MGFQCVLSKHGELYFSGCPFQVSQVVVSRVPTASPEDFKMIVPIYD